MNRLANHGLHGMHGHLVSVQSVAWAAAVA
jgi:hypothetical protein